MSAAVRVVLFDIDGTLLASSGAGRRAMEAALQATFGTPGPSTYRYDGKTDRQIVREQMRTAGHDDRHIDRLLPALEREYLRRLQLEIARAPGSVTCFPGVRLLLDAMRSVPHRVTGLLTGNVAGGAAAKLGAAGIDLSWFQVCAYGSDHEVRAELPPIAQRRARETLGHEVSGDHIVIIGDTPADIACGRGIGAKAIAVATGHYSVDQLAAHEPAHVFADLSDTAAVLAAISNA